MTSDGIFRLVSLVALAAAAAGVVLHFLRAGRSRRAAAPEPGEPTVRRYGRVERLVLLLAILTGLLLAATGFLPVVVGERLSGYLLMLHVTAGGALAFFVAVLAVLWAGDCRFEPHDAAWCRRCCSCCCGGAGDGGELLEAGRFDAGQKAAFWMLLPLVAAMALTAVASMLPLFSPEGIETLREVHRYCGLAAVLVGVVHWYRTMVARRGSWRWLVSGKVGRSWAEHYHNLWWRAVRRETKE